MSEPHYQPKESAEPKVLELHLAPREPLTPYGEEFIIPSVNNGQDVWVGRAFTGEEYYLHCDYETFESKLQDVTPSKLNEMFVADGKLESQFPELDEDTRKLLYICWRTSRIVRNLLGNVASDHARNMSFDAYRQVSKTGQKESIKPLSKCEDESVCSEYALLAHEVLRRMGVDSAIVVGAYDGSDEGNMAGRHTYLVLQEGQRVFDPTQTTQQTDIWPPRVFIPIEPLTLQTLRNMSTAEDEPNGHKIVCQDIVTKQKVLYGSGA